MYVGRRSYSHVVAFLDGASFSNESFLPNLTPFVRMRFSAPTSNWVWSAEVANAAVGKIKSGLLHV